MKFFKELFKRAEDTDGYLFAEQMSIANPHLLTFDKGELLLLPHDTVVGVSKMEKGIQYVCVKEGVNLSGIDVGGLSKRIEDSEFCFYRGVDIRKKTIFPAHSRIQKSLWVEEPVYSFVQTFLKNPKRFVVLKTKECECIVDTVTGNTFKRTPGHPMFGPLWNYPKLEFIGQESLDWAGKQIFQYYSDRSIKLGEINAVRKRKKWMKDYVGEGAVDGE